MLVESFNLVPSLVEYRFQHRCVLWPSLIIVTQLSFSPRGTRWSISITRPPNLRSRPQSTRDRLTIFRLSFLPSSKIHSLLSRLLLVRLLSSSLCLPLSLSFSPQISFLIFECKHETLAYSLGADRHTSARIELDLQTELFIVSRVLYGTLCRNVFHVRILRCNPCRIRRGICINS